MRFSLRRLLGVVAVVALSLGYVRRVGSDYRFALWIAIALSGIVFLANGPMFRES